MYKPYTGVGSRKAPKEITGLIIDISIELHKRGFTLRSGGADGCDIAFENGCGSSMHFKEIYVAQQATTQAMAIAERFHPNWRACSNYARKLHGRNAFQVLGPHLNQPSKFLLCWTPDGCTSHKERSIQTGGTGTAISIADYYNVPVFNLARNDHRQRLEGMLKGAE